jgi:hypothetical protein
VPWHVTPRTVDKGRDEWWERERGRRPSRRSLLEHDDAADEEAQRAAPEQMTKEMRWASLVEMR